MDMETSAVAALCSERASGSCRSGSSATRPGSTCRKEIATLMTRSGSYQVGAALRAIWNRPSSLKDSGPSTNTPRKPPTGWRTSR